MKTITTKTSSIRTIAITCSLAILMQSAIGVASDTNAGVPALEETIHAQIRPFIPVGNSSTAATPTILEQMIDELTDGEIADALAQHVSPAEAVAQTSRPIDGGQPADRRPIQANTRQQDASPIVYINNTGQLVALLEEIRDALGHGVSSASSNPDQQNLQRVDRQVACFRRSAEKVASHLGGNTWTELRQRQEAEDRNVSNSRAALGADGDKLPVATQDVVSKAIILRHEVSNLCDQVAGSRTGRPFLPAVLSQPIAINPLDDGAGELQFAWERTRGGAVSLLGYNLLAVPLMRGADNNTRYEAIKRVCESLRNAAIASLGDPQYKQPQAIELLRCAAVVEEVREEIERVLHGGTDGLIQRCRLWNLWRKVEKISIAASKAAVETREHLRIQKK
jgi:hypothetical protein